MEQAKDRKTQAPQKKEYPQEQTKFRKTEKVDNTPQKQAKYNA